MPRMYTWDTLPQVIKDMDPDEREEYLSEKGILLVPAGVAPPPNAIANDDAFKRQQSSRNIDTSSADVMGFGPGLTNPKNSENMAKAGVGVASTLAGGGGPVAAGAMGLLNMAAGPDPFSGRGVAEAGANVLFGRLAPFMNAGQKGGEFVRALKNGAMGTGQVGATQLLGNALTQNPVPMEPTSMLGAAAASALAPAAAGRFLKAVEKSTPMVRGKMQPIVERLTRKPDAVETLPSPTPTVPTAQPSAATPIATPAPSAAPTKPFIPPARQENANKMADLLHQHGISAEDAALLPDEQWQALATAAGVKTPSKDTIGVALDVLRSKSNPSSALPTKQTLPATANVSAQSSQNDEIAEQLRATLRARGYSDEEIERGLAATSSPTPKPSPTAATTSTAGAPPPTPAAPLDLYDSIDNRIGDLTTERMDVYKKGMQGKNIRENTDAMAVIGEMRRTGSRKFIDDLVSSKDWSDVPRKLDNLDAAFPDGEHRTAIKEKITESIMSAVGTGNDPFGDLSPVQRIQAFGKQKFGNKTGVEVINKIFGSEHAYQNISDLQEIISAAGKSTPGDTTKLRIFWNNARPVIGATVGGGALSGLVNGFTAYVPVLGAAGIAAGGYGTVKALTIGMDTAVDWLSRKGTKWADVLYDLATGGNRYSRQTVSNVISGLRRAAEEERDLSQEEALAEMAQYQ